VKQLWGLGFLALVGTNKAAAEQTKTNFLFVFVNEKLAGVRHGEGRKRKKDETGEKNEVAKRMQKQEEEKQREKGVYGQKTTGTELTY
jgi:hypothetical protein